MQRGLQLRLEFEVFLSFAGGDHMKYNVRGDPGRPDEQPIH